MGSGGRGDSSGSAVLPDVSEIMSAFARVYFPARVVQGWKKISLSAKKKKKFKKKERAGRGGEAEWGQGRQRGPCAGMCAAAERFVWG